MGRKRVYSISEIVRQPTLLSEALPFDVTKNGEVVATVISPKSGEWHECENCGENTQNIIQFQNSQLEWEKITLCDKCSEKLLG